jgi:predicted CopG family antitoxin
MGTKQMRVSEDLYARVKAENRDGETLSETLDRLVGGYSLTEFADDAAELDLDVSLEEATDESVGATPPSHE